MSSHLVDSNLKPKTDAQLTAIADYVWHAAPFSSESYQTATLCLMDSIACGILALQYPACSKLLGPIIPGTVVPNGARVPGTNYQLDPILAAFNIGTIIRWLDFNDTWLAAEWGHPSDNLGAILAVTDYVARKNIAAGKTPPTVHTVLDAMIKAHEIQGVLALENAFNRLGIDHVILVKIASTAVATHLLGGTHADITNALSHAFVDGQALRTYRHAPNTGTRKSWAAGDATARAVRLAWLTLQGEMGYPSALTADKWGFNANTLQGKALKINQPYASYVMDHILFKISYPAEFHAQTAVECAVQLHPLIKNKIDAIDKIVIQTHESAIRIISKSGPLHNPADRDHCLQYMVAVALLEGTLTADHYENDYAAQNIVIDELRAKMQITENKEFTKDYLDPKKRSIANTIQIYFKDGSHTDAITVEYPIGHRTRRPAGIPLLYAKFKENMLTLYKPDKVAELLDLFQNQTQLTAMPVNQLLDMLAL